MHLILPIAVRRPFAYNHNMTNTSSLPTLAVTGYTAEQKLKNHVMLRALAWEKGILAMLKEWGENPTPEGLETAYDRAVEEFPDTMQDARNECRQGTEETGLPASADFRMLRHYEAKSVAALMVDGSWVGWLYWHGGGKHGEPESIDWMEDAYHLDVTEEERVVVVRNFLKAPQPLLA